MRKLCLSLITFTLIGLWSAHAQTTLNLWMLADGTLDPYFEEVIASFQEANPDIKVNMQTYANEAYKTAIQVGIASDAPPDIYFNWAGDDSFRYVREGQAADLTEYANRDGWGEVAPGATAAFSLDGKVYGIPMQQLSKYFYYNKEIFEREGLSEPATFDELLTLCTTLKDKGITPISFGNSERWPGVHYLTIFNQKVVGESVTENDYNLSNSAETLFTDPGYEVAFQKLLDMQNAGCFNEAPNSISPEVARALFFSGETAMTYCGTWCIAIMNDNGFEGKYSLFRMPAITDGKGNQNFVMAGPQGLQVSAKTQNMDAVAKFVAYLMSQENQALLLNKYNALVVRADAVNPDATDPMVAWVIDDLSKAEGTAMWLDTLLENSVSEAYLNAIQEVLNGTKTPEEAVELVRTAAVAAKEKMAQ
jgi:raffinose/stachyose/melibiose transport system substrate-binding protein